MDMKLDFLRFSISGVREPIEFTEDGMLTWFKGVFPQFFDDRLYVDSELWTNFQHYDFCIALANRVLIYYDSMCKNHNKGVNVSIPSGGLWIISELFGFDNFIDFISYLLELSLEKGFKIKFTRIDICFDDFDYDKPGHYKSAFEFNSLINRFVCKTQFKHCVQMDPNESEFIPLRADRSIMGGRSMGWSFYLGRRSGGRTLRIYDKYAESDRKRRKYLQYHPGDFDNAPEWVDSVRYEFEIHKEYANNLIWSIIKAKQNGESYSMADFCDSWFRISGKDLDRDNNNQSRNFVEDEKWHNFIHDNSSLTQTFDKPDLFTRERRPISYYNSEAWLNKCVMPFLSVHFAIHGNLDHLEEYCYHLVQQSEYADKYKQMIHEITGLSFESVRDYLFMKYAFKYEEDVGVKVCNPFNI